MTVYPVPDSSPVLNDDGFRKNQNLEALAKLKPFFKKTSTGLGEMTISADLPLRKNSGYQGNFLAKDQGFMKWDP